jgi:peptide/nickel transport system substrate-binding protein
MFCQNVDPTGNTSIGSGKLDGEGIPPDFFSDIDVRKGFMHAFDREVYAKDVLQNISTIPTNPNIPGLPYAIEVPVYEFDLEKAKAHLQQAWNGEVWEKGFRMTINYDVGNARREAVAVMLAENIMSLNPKFQIDIQAVDSKDYMVKFRNYQYPMWILGWIADYPDPHNFLYTFMHSNGYYGNAMRMSNTELDALVEAGIQETDSQKRAEIYEQLQNLWYTEAIGLCLYQSTEVRHYRSWVQGFVPNPTDTDVSEWFFRLWKEEE